MMIFTFIIISVHITQPVINLWRFSVSITTISGKGKKGFEPFRDDNEGKCMDNFAYVGASDGLCRPWHRKISDQHGQRYGRKISRIIQSDVIPYKGENHGEVISRVSSAFLGTPYQADTLIGGPGIPEVLVANFNGVDCFTLADYVEALAPQR